MGATFRNGRSCIERLKLSEDREKRARNVMAKMSEEQLSELVFLPHHGADRSEVLDAKIHGLVIDFSS